ALQHEDAAHLAETRAHRHEHRDIPVLLHHHHHQRDENIQRGDQLNQPDGNDGYDALHLERTQNLLVALLPGHRGVFGTGGLFDRLRELFDAIQIVDIDLDLIDHVARAQEALCWHERRKRPFGVDLVEAGLENPGHAEAACSVTRAEGDELVACTYC